MKNVDNERRTDMSEDTEMEGTEKKGRGKAKKEKPEKKTPGKGSIPEPKFETKTFGITGESELVLERFSMKALRSDGESSLPWNILVILWGA